MSSDVLWSSVSHLNYILFLFALPKQNIRLNYSGYVCSICQNKTFGYTTLMGVPPKLQWLCLLDLPK